MTTVDKVGRIQDILETVKVPCYPPNKSQWKKLELAVKFINISKTSAATTRRASMKIEPRKTSVHSNSECDKKLNSDDGEEEEENLSDDTDEGWCHKVGKKRSRWSKVSKSLNSIA